MWIEAKVQARLGVRLDDTLACLLVMAVVMATIREIRERLWVRHNEMVRKELHARRAEWD